MGQIKFTEFIKHHLGELKGDIVELKPERKKENIAGYYYYTIGQRSGLGLGGGPWYVVQKDVEKNIVYISREDFSQRARNEFNVTKFNWILEEPPAKRNLLVKIRHGAKFFNCELDIDEKGNGKVKLEKPDQGIAPGQFAVFYDDQICLGGGVIGL